MRQSGLHPEGGSRFFYRGMSAFLRPCQGRAEEFTFFDIPSNHACRPEARGIVRRTIFRRWSEVERRWNTINGHRKNKEKIGLDLHIEMEYI
jgi:hypothetical protein